MQGIGVKLIYNVVSFLSVCRMAKEKYMQEIVALKDSSDAKLLKVMDNFPDSLMKIWGNMFLLSTAKHEVIQNSNRPSDLDRTGRSDEQ